MFFAIICTSSGLELGTNGEEGQEDFEDGATWVVLVGGFDVAGDDMGTGYFEKDELCLDDSIREKGEERLEGVVRAVHRGGDERVFRKTAALSPTRCCQKIVNNSCFTYPHLPDTFQRDIQLTPFLPQD